jgi:hypothetical protein
LAQTILGRLRELSETAPSDDVFNKTFDMFWPELKKRLEEAAGETLLVVNRRTAEQMLEELLGVVRRLERESRDQVREEVRREEEIRKDAFDAAVRREIIVRLSGVEATTNPLTGPFGDIGSSWGRGKSHTAEAVMAAIRKAMEAEPPEPPASIPKPPVEHEPQ